MIIPGTRPVKTDHRDYSFPRTFGAVHPLDFPTEFNTDVGLTMPDQNSINPLFTPVVPALPEGCTGYTTSELGGDEDHTIYNPQYTYRKTLFIEGRDSETGGCDIRDSLKSAIIYGLERIDEKDDGSALSHRRGQYFNVSDETGLDDFDDIRSAILTNGRSVSIGTPWFPEWDRVNIGQTGVDGIVHEVDFTQYTRKTFFTGRLILSANLGWHNWKICGWKTINGQPYLVGKTWQGSSYGDKGLAYFSRQTINSVMLIDGTAAFTLAKATPENIQNIKHTTLDFILTYLKRWNVI